MKMIDDENPAQQGTILVNLATAIGVQSLDSWNWRGFLLQMLQTEIIQDLHMKNPQRTCQNNGELMMNSRKSECEIWRILREFESFWIGSEKVIILFNSVRIRLLYMLLIHSLIMISTKLDD